MTIAIDRERFAALDTIRLKRGEHASPEDGLCVMEAAAWVAGEPHSDHPDCVSPVLGAFMRRWNDDLDDEGRQKLKPLILRAVGTGGDGQDEARGWLALDWLVRVHLPAWLGLAGFADEAGALRALLPLRDEDSLDAARPLLDAARAAARAAVRAAAVAAAWDAAVAAARDAVRAAAGAAARAAARDAAVAAAWDAAVAAARDAVRAAAGAAAGAAAWEAARDALDLTVVELQVSALGLLDRMIDPKEAEPRRPRLFDPPEAA